MKVGSTAVADETITFTLNGKSEGTAVTNASGVATLSNVSLAGISANSYSGYVGASFAGDINYNYNANSISENLTVAPAPLTVSGLTVVNKTYDGTTAATFSGGGTLVGVVSGDNVTLSGTPTGTFASANVGTGITVTVSGLGLNGSAAGNYTLTEPTLTANISAAPLTVTGSGTQVYGGSPSYSASYNGFVLSQNASVLGGSLSYSTTTSSSSNVGTYSNAVTPGGLTSSNYAISFAAARWLSALLR